ncbi:MAG: nitrogen fixation negative regulator NifL [Methylococcales bacterium]|nr:nitrogen fixation negative regulator NifL [Methylococcales bacterium]
MSKISPAYLENELAAEVIEIISPELGQQKISISLPLCLFVKAVEQTPIAISITDKKANILYINAAFTDVTGYTEAEIFGKNEAELSDKCTPAEIYQNLWQTISSKQIWRGHLVNRTKQGERYLAEVTIAPMLDKQGEISHYIGMHRDVTNTHQAEQQLSNQKKLIESVINASPVAMVVLDSTYRIILDNQMYQTLISELRHDEPALFFINALQQEFGDLWADSTLRTHGFSNHEIRVEGVGQRGTRWFSCSGNWFSEENTEADNFFFRQSKDYLLLSICDVTLQRQQQEKLQLQTLQNMMAEEEHIRSIRETLLGAMHQIRLPLNQVNAAVQIMTQRNDSQNLHLKMLLTQVQQMGEEALNTLQRCVPEIPESAVMPVNLNQLLHQVIRLFSNKFLANGIIVDWLPNSTLPSILGSDNKLRMLFKQLIDNAVDAMNRASSRERVIKIGTSVENDWVCVTIADTGSGIPANQRSKVFEPFFTTQTAGGFQAGMGLVMAREIVNQHDGMIEIDPDYTNGCCFNLRFPICPKK